MKFLLPAIAALAAVTGVHGQGLEIYVSDAGNFDQPPWQILKYDENGQNPEVFTTDNLGWPQDILFLEQHGEVLISNLNTGRINRHDADTGDFVSIFAAGIGQPTRMKIGPDGLLYVLQWAGDGRVKRYQLDGTFVDDFTNVGVSQSIGLDWDEQGNLYVSSFNGANVRRFDPQGNDLGLFVTSNLQGPTNIWFDASGDLLVSDWSGTAVKRFRPNGNFRNNFITGLSQSEGVDFLPNGNILIGNGATAAVKMYDADGNFIQDLVPSGSGGLLKPNAVVIRDPDAGFEINAGLNDAWFNPATAGQGFFIIVLPEIGQVFAAWFTYDTQRPDPGVQAILGDAGHRWLTAQGPFDGNVADLTLLVTTGGVFDAADPPASTDVGGDGKLTITFEDCTRGVVHYEITSLALSGDVPIQRIANDNVALCEAL